jgi:glycosyltransferase involved in cell wall biosynthesis
MSPGNISRRRSSFDMPSPAYPESAMRILHFMQAIDFRMGGPPRAVVDQVATMHARGHDAIVATTVTRDVPEAWLEAGASPRAVSLPPVGGPLARLSHSALQTIESEIEAADVVHLHGVWEVSSLQVAAVARRVGRPYVISLRGMLDDWSMAQRGLKKRIYLRLGGRRYLESACRVHCTADAELAQSRKWFPHGHGAVVPNLIDLAPFESAPDPEPAKTTWPQLSTAPFRLLFLSRVQYKKGIEHLIDAIEILRDRGRDLVAVIAGSGDDDYLTSMKARAEAGGLGDRILWTGHVGGDLKWSLYAASDVFALPTSQENFGFVFFESLAAGTPVITTDLVDTRDEIARSGGGVIVPQSASAFADAIESFMDGRRDAGVMGDAGRRWTLEHLDTATVAARFERLYEDCVGRRP